MSRPKDQKRVPLSLRVTPDLRRCLIALAKAKGRSLTQETEFRLERSFRDDEVLAAIEALADNPIEDADDERRCNTCGFWQQLHSGLGECHRLAPEFSLTGGCWPGTSTDDWCGEWRAG